MQITPGNSVLEHLGERIFQSLPGSHPTIMGDVPLLLESLQITFQHLSETLIRLVAFFNNSHINNSHI